MPARKRGSLAFAFAAAAVAAAAAFAAFRLRGASAETDVFAMLGDGESALRDGLPQESANTVFAVFSSAGAAVSRKASEKFASLLPPDFDCGLEGASLAEFSRRASGLVAAADFKPLSTPEGRARIARAAVRRYAASPVPPAFPPQDDPFCLKERFLFSFAESADAILPVRLPAGAAADASDPGRPLEPLRKAAAETLQGADPSLRIAFCGVPVHAAAATAKCRREIGWLSLFSSAIVLLTALAAFRPVSRALHLAAAMAFSASAGATALFLYSPRFHVMTAVFGTTVLGLAADYSFHRLLHREGDRSVPRNTAVSFATTAISLSPLFFSSLPVLRQSAVFLAAALAAAFVFSAVAQPGLPPREETGAETPRRRVPLFALRAAALAVAAVSAFAAAGVRIRTAPSAIYRPPPEIAATEKLLAAKWAPPPEAVSEDVRRLYAEHARETAEALGLESVPVPPQAPRSAAEALSAALDALTEETSARLVYALAAMAAALAAIYRLKAFAVAAPSVAAFLAAAAAVSLSGQDVTMFHLLAGFLLAGMCVDYTVFLRSGGRGSFKSAFCSLVTSMAGFGALAFVSFRPAAAFGTVLGAGLPAGFLAAAAAGGGAAARRGGAVEKAASPLGMEIVWLAGRLFGPGAMRFAAVLAANCIWLCSPSVRRAARSRRKLAFFARSLADKVALASGRIRPPRVALPAGGDAAEFARDASSGRGLFAIVSHCGTPEALLAAAKDAPLFHAWTDMDRTSAFSAFYAKHACGGRIALHPTAGIGMETAFEAMDWLGRGECLVMAGDRGSGAFRFAAALGRPVYFAACIAEGSGYRAEIVRLRGSAAEMERVFREALARLEEAHPEQVYEWGRG